MPQNVPNGAGVGPRTYADWLCDLVKAQVAPEKEPDCAPGCGCGAPCTCPPPTDGEVSCPAPGTPGAPADGPRNGGHGMTPDQFLLAQGGNRGYWFDALFRANTTEESEKATKGVEAALDNLRKQIGLSGDLLNAMGMQGSEGPAPRIDLSPEHLEALFHVPSASQFAGWGAFLSEFAGLADPMLEMLLGKSRRRQEQAPPPRPPATAARRQALSAPAARHGLPAAAPAPPGAPDEPPAPRPRPASTPSRAPDADRARQPATFGPRAPAPEIRIEEATWDRPAARPEPFEMACAPARLRTPSPQLPRLADLDPFRVSEAPRAAAHTLAFDVLAAEQQGFRPAPAQPPTAGHSGQQDRLGANDGDEMRRYRLLQMLKQVLAGLEPASPAYVEVRQAIWNLLKPGSPVPTDEAFKAWLDRVLGTIEPVPSVFRQHGARPDGPAPRLAYRDELAIAHKPARRP